MGSTKKIKKCEIKGCNKVRMLVYPGKRLDISRFCTTHRNNGTSGRFLSKVYNDMKRRVDGKTGHDRGNWKGKSILPRDVFKMWAKNHPDFLSLYKRYVMNGFDIKLAPSVNRIDSNKGYTLDNMEWMTHSQNCGLAGSVKKMNNQETKTIYKVLGVNKNV